MVQFTPSNSSKRYGASLSPAASSDMPQQQDSGSFTFKQQQQQQQQQQRQAPAGLSHSSSSVAAVSDEQLFQTPSDLVCPITLSLFQDPVCNALGQVYERAALQRHLLQAAVSGQQPTDPVSNAVLPSLDLVPVWPMRSRAAEYRDTTMRACVQAAAAPDCADPVRYLRRAAELVLSTDPAVTSRLSTPSSGSATPVASTAAASPASARTASASSTSATGPAAPPAGADVSAGNKAAGGGSPAGMPVGAAAEGSGGSASTASAPGLTVEFAKYLAAHEGSQYDALVLKYFGNELLRSGCPDAASNVFYRLLLGAEDREQQAEYLQLCLDCWTCSSGDDGGADGSWSSTDAKAASQHSSKGGQVLSGAASSLIISKLADFVQRQRCLNPRVIVQMLGSTHHGSAMAMQLCQVLLTRAAETAAAAGPVENAEAALGLPGGLGGVLEVMLEFVELGHGQLVGQVQQLTRQVQEMQQMQAQQQQGGKAAAGVAAVGGVSEQGLSAEGGVAQQPMSASSEAAGGGARSGSRRSRVFHWRGGKGSHVLVGRLVRAAAAGTLAAASLVTGNHAALRLARVGSLMYLLRAGL